MPNTILKTLAVLLLACSPLIFAQYGELTVEQEQRAHSIDQLLMAPCCWAKTIAEDNSGIAMQLKQQVRDLLRAGKSDEEVLAYFESEYGEKIFSSPKKENFNLLLWLLPFILMPILMVLLYQLIQSWRRKRIVKQSIESENTVVNKTAMNESSLDESEYDKYVSELDKELYGDSEK